MKQCEACLRGGRQFVRGRASERMRARIADAGAGTPRARVRQAHGMEETTKLCGRVLRLVRELLLARAGAAEAAAPAKSAFLTGVALIALHRRSRWSVFQASSASVGIARGRERERESRGQYYSSLKFNAVLISSSTRRLSVCHTAALPTLLSLPQNNPNDTKSNVRFVNYTIVIEISLFLLFFWQNRAKCILRFSL